MGIWYSFNFETLKYFKLVLFSSQKVKLVVNNSIKKSLRTTLIFKDGAKFLDTLYVLSELPFTEFTELFEWIKGEY